MKYKYNLKPDGTEISHSNVFESIGYCHGHPWMMFHRAQLIAFLYEKLNERDSRVLTNKEVVSIDTYDHGVKVRCLDGSVFEGSIVIGADGVHSTVRCLMNRVAAAPANVLPITDAPFVTYYRGLYGHGPRPEVLQLHTMYETHGDDFTIQVNVSAEQVSFFIYERLPKPTRERLHYSAADTEKFAKRFAQQHVTQQLKFGDLWASRKWAKLANVEEGIVKTWHCDRIVLLGDAAHKMAPNAGLGLNCGLQSAVVLANILRGQLSRSSCPDTKSLVDCFAKYQASRFRDVKRTIDISGLYTRVVAWQNLAWKIIDLHVSPHTGGDIQLVKTLISPLIQKGAVLDFISESAFQQGKLPWRHTPIVCKRT
ncbi:FAD binding domain-containing protein [Scedosporium apiospermum]|uniref:FAD binding domain-containing protein n=1 Tax=Pseudallescheria apiosperma TaxID=563466 RepID=A0A084G0B1_PSEDA|nr:FAD binding domain-containing protein [Scedosporium apiospermum]KEZ40773.1 FAD binding domain-containing protein [Scedosporium apiospermum]